MGGSSHLLLLIPDKKRRLNKALATGGDDGRVRKVAAVVDAAEDARDRRRLRVELSVGVGAIARPLPSRPSVRLLVITNNVLRNYLSSKTCAIKP